MSLVCTIYTILCNAVVLLYLSLLLKEALFLYQNWSIIPMQYFIRGNYLPN